MYTVRDIVLSITSDDIDEAVEYSKHVTNPDEIIDSTSHFTLLHRLAQGAAAGSDNDIAFAELMASLKADFDIKDIKGRTPLMILSGLQTKYEKLDFFIKNTKDINAKDRNGNNALMHAAMNKCLENVQTLLRLGAELNSFNKEGKSALKIIDEYIGDAGMRVVLNEKVIQDAQQSLEEMTVVVMDDGSREVTIDNETVVIEPIAVKPMARARRF